MIFDGWCHKCGGDGTEAQDVISECKYYQLITLTNKESLSGMMIALPFLMNPIINKMVIALTEEIRILSHNGDTVAKHCDDLNRIVTSLGDDMNEVRNLSTIFRKCSDALQHNLDEIKTVMDLG